MRLPAAITRSYLTHTYGFGADASDSFFYIVDLVNFEKQAAVLKKRRRYLSNMGSTETECMN